MFLQNMHNQIFTQSMIRIANTYPLLRDTATVGIVPQQLLQSKNLSHYTL